jgi:LmbE family N-acetylglucosaminyl deacetylase
MGWIYLSPHFDDVALSCGGSVWEQTQRGESVSIWTICAGDRAPAPLSPFAETLHQRWQTGLDAVPRRKEEDLASCQVMGASPTYFSIPDCIYRVGPDNTPLYTSEEAIFGSLHPLEAPLLAQLAADLARCLPEQGDVVCPLALGGHVDHRLVHAAAWQALQDRSTRRLWFYADVPYVIQQATTLEDIRQGGWKSHTIPLSSEGLAAWQEAIAAHASQISSFWPDLERMRNAIRRYCEENGGLVLWQKDETK